MKLAHHVTVSIAVSGALYSISRSWALAAASFISGTLVDLDHFIDYWIRHGLRFDMKHFFYYFDENNFGTREKIYFVFHGWEWLILLTASAWLTDWHPLFTGLLIGYGHHIIFDELYNTSRYRLRPYLLGYSLLWRWKNGFKFKTSLPDTKTSCNKNSHPG